MPDDLEHQLKHFLQCDENERKNHVFLINLREYVKKCITFHLKNQKSDIEDLTQESFFKIINIDLNKVENIKGYVGTIARNSCYDFFKKASNRSTQVELSVVESECFLPEDLEEEKKEILYLLKEIIDEMTQNCKTLLDMQQYKRISDREVSLNLGIVLNQIPQNRVRCLSKLKKYLESDKKSLLEDLRSLL